jgi:hypothetical protein
MTNSRSDYDHWLDGDDVLIIVDRNLGGRAVTNDVDEIIPELAAEGLPIDQLLIVYRDSTGRWDQILTNRGQFEGFAPIGVKDEAEATRRVRQL